MEEGAIVAKNHFQQAFMLPTLQYRPRSISSYSYDSSVEGWRWLECKAPLTKFCFVLCYCCVVVVFVVDLLLRRCCVVVVLSLIVVSCCVVLVHTLTKAASTSLVLKYTKLQKFANLLALALLLIHTPKKPFW